MKNKSILIVTGVGVVLAGLVGWSLLAFLIVRSGVLSIQEPAQDATGFSAKFGILSDDLAGNTSLSQETVTIPMKYKDTNFEYGCQIYPPDNRPYTCWCVLHFPSAPKVLSGTGFTSSEPSTTVQTVKTETRGVSTINFQFDEGDPLGQQSMDVYVNGQLVKTFTYNVVPADGSSGGK